MSLSRPLCGGVVLVLSGLLWGCGEPQQQDPPLIIVDDENVVQIGEMRVEPTSLRLALGEVRALDVQFFDEEGGRLDASSVLDDVVFTSSDPEVVAIEEDGALHGVAEGSTQVQVSYAGFEQVVEVEVRYARWRKVSGGIATTCALDWEGEVYCWGYNAATMIRSDGQIDEVIREPTRRAGLSDIIDIALSDMYACAVDDRGWVYCWGDNREKQAGVDGINLVETPLRVGELEGMVKVAVGAQHTCALSGEGAMFCWGSNLNDAVGEGAGVSTSRPVSIPFDEPIVEIALNRSNTCALAKSGKVYCWGLNAYGAVNPTQEAESFAYPERVILPGRAKSVGVSNLAGCAVLENGEAYCWGANPNGNIGVRFDADIYEATRVPEVPSFARVEMGPHTVCGLTADGELWCWGLNRHGQAGHGSKSVPAEPAKVVGEQRWKQVGLGAYTTCALDLDGEIWCWGLNDSAQVGDGRQITGYPLRPVRGEARFSEVVTSYRTSCARGRGTSDWQCWGRNIERQMQYTSVGLMTIPTTMTPWQPEKLALGGYTGCGIVVEGEGRSETQCWGLNQHQGLGLPGSYNSTLGPRTMDPQRLNFKEISLNQYHGCGVAGSGEMYCWGNNYYGEVGMSPQQYAVAPRRVETRADYVAVSTGFYHSCGLTDAGEIRCWGANNLGQLGRAATDSWGAPEAIESDDVYVEVGAGEYNTCARTTAGEVHCWGAREMLGGPRGSSTVTDPIILSGQWEDIEIYDQTLCALNDGTLSCAGWSGSGLITQGGVGFVSDFYEVTTDVDVTQISMGYAHFCVLDAGGRAHCKGSNFNGELGDGAMVEHLEPYRVGNDR